MKKLILIALLTGSAAFGLACSGDDKNNDGGTDSGPADTGGGDVKQTDGGTDSGIPTPPTLKTQIDRMGRPAINTALNHVFDTDAGAAGVAKDAYNADKNVGGWGAAYTPEFAKNLPVFDALDSTTVAGGDGCGNQAGFTIAHSYATLAGLAADDRLYMDTGKATCTTYLAVELNFTGIKTNTDCGGRKLDYDVIDATYGAVSGVLTGVPDGISAPAAKTSGTTFPYLAPPQ